MHYELLMAFAAISRMSEAWLPDRRPRATFEPRAQRGRRRLLPVLRALATRLLRTGPKR
jgi:hypothetical protein